MNTEDLSIQLRRWLGGGREISAPRSQLMDRLARLTASLRALGPYAAVALTLPGGTLIALTLLTVRHRSALPPLRGVILAAIVAAAVVLRGSS